ncbi:MAG: ABC transporter permease [bacterium]|nr:ABC transporter permease [bacterium]
MKSINIVIKELSERKNQLVTSFIAIVLGITVIVAIKTITYFSEKAVARELDNLGANVLILPKFATVNDYYTADFEGEELPEDYVDKITASDLKGVDNLSPKLSFSVIIDEKKVNLTGILPKSEFKTKPMWQTAGTIFSPPAGCGTTAPPPSSDKRVAIRNRVIDSLAQNEVLIGSEVATRLKLSEGSKLKVRGEEFSVIAILPETGTLDDTRIFAHLHTVQRLFGKGSVVSVIEMIGCCKEISKGLINGLNKLLPDAKVVTVKQIVSTQQNTNEMMSKFSIIFLIIIILVGGVSIANYMFANVHERRKEIGALLAIGATPGKISSLFLMKSLILGFCGGVVGYFVGTLLAVTLGPKIAKVTVLPIPSLLGYSILISILITTLSSLIPARKAARMDPADILKEI